MKFIFGFTVGLLTGALLLASTIVAFFGGILVGQKLFGQSDDVAPSTPTEEPT